MKPNGYKIVCESLSNDKNIDLENFDERLFNKQVSKDDQEKSGLKSSSIKYNIIKNIGEHEFVLSVVGFIGCIPSKKDPKIAFVQILVLPKYRGQGILQLAEDKLAHLHKFKSLLATIDLDNISSIKSHLKAGFKYFPKSQLNEWRKLGFLKENQTRLYKDYV